MVVEAYTAFPVLTGFIHTYPHEGKLMLIDDTASRVSLEGGGGEGGREMKKGGEGGRERGRDVMQGGGGAERCWYYRIL
jgi:hypothetical protein